MVGPNGRCSSRAQNWPTMTGLMNSGMIRMVMTAPRPRKVLTIARASRSPSTNSSDTLTMLSHTVVTVDPIATGSATNAAKVAEPDESMARHREVIIDESDPQREQQRVECDYSGSAELQASTISHLKLRSSQSADLLESPIVGSDVVGERGRTCPSRSCTLTTSTGRAASCSAEAGSAKVRMTASMDRSRPTYSRSRGAVALPLLAQVKTDLGHRRLIHQSSVTAWPSAAMVLSA